MARKRMFSLSVIETDAFLDLPLSAQALYFHLNMRADDDGFVGNPQRITSFIGAGADDFKLLVAKRFLITFEDGVIVIKHWRMHNTIQKDRYAPTVFQDELSMLRVKENKSYTLNQTETKCIQNVSTDKDIDIDIGKDMDNIHIDNADDLPNVEDKKAKEDELKKNFQIIYDSYPKKVGRTKAFGRYKLWMTTGKVVNGHRRKLTNKQIWSAIAKYKSEMEQKETEMQYYKNFDTFMGDSILDYVD